jgi:DNA-binding IclR family transcriptional regulator
VTAEHDYFVRRTLGVLELLADAPRSTTEVADALAIHQRTARRMLNRLVHDGYATRRAGNRPVYTLAPRFSELARRALRQRWAR